MSWWKIFRSKNVGWKGDEPTDIVKRMYKEGKIKTGDSIVDIGCGFGRNSNWLAGEGVKATGVNINKEELKYAQNRAKKLELEVEYLYANATNLPFNDNFFDVALDLGCSHMISSHEGQKKAMKEALRVLKKKGYLIYFGFSKEHPAYMTSQGKVKFRDIEDIKKMYGKGFEILSTSTNRWKAKKGEGGFTEHVGIEVLMRKK